jgi:hypothetical protein
MAFHQHELGILPKIYIQVLVDLRCTSSCLDADVGTNLGRGLDIKYCLLGQETLGDLQLTSVWLRGTP